MNCRYKSSKQKKENPARQEISQIHTIEIVVLNCYSISLILILVVKHVTTIFTLSFKNPTMTTTRSKSLKTKSSSKMSKSKTVNTMKSMTIISKKAKTVNFKNVKTDQAKMKAIKNVAKVDNKKPDETPNAKYAKFDLD